MDLVHQKDLFTESVHTKVSYLIFIYSLLVEDSQSKHFLREMCLEKTLTIQAFIKQKICPYKYLETEKDSGTSVVVSLSCLVGGGLIGISSLVLVKRLKTHKQRLQPPPVFYSPNYGDGGDVLGERTVTIGNPQETEYADNEDTIRMVAKAIQVPSYKEDSSSDSRSRENIDHHLIEDSTQSAFTFSDSIAESLANPV